jgi:cytochrome P450
MLPREPLTKNMLDLDPPDHTRLRALVQKAFTTRFVDNLRPRVQEIANELLLRVRKKRRMDLINDFASPLPITVIAEILGIPPSQGTLSEHSLSGCCQDCCQSG